MEQQFKKLLQKTKAQKEQKDPLYKSFEGALFQASSWFFQFQDQPIPVVARPETAAATVAATPVDPALPSLSEVLFVGDTYDGEGEDLLGKMIQAMKLKENEFYRFKMDEELENVTDLSDNLQSPSPATQRLLDLIAKKRPKIVVSLGATVTNILLGRREKLSTIHGQFLEKQHAECVYSLIPLFHPSYLTINPNMKRAAWIDLQKVMERIGKI
ncbi:MAG: uracil-DNA glycosylase family protein [Bacteriovorax sp.]